MATSGSFDYYLTTNQIIQEALEQVGLIRVNQTPSGDLIASAMRTLNSMLKIWQATTGMRLWTVERRFYSLSASSVVLGSDGVDYRCINNHTSAANTVPVTGAKYAGYWFELETTAGSAHVDSTAYTSLNHVDLEDDVIDLWQEGHTVRRGEQDFPIYKFTREEFEEKLNKNENETSRTRRVYFDRGRDNPYLKVWPWPDDTTDLLSIQIVRKLEDFDAATNNPDTTAKYLEALSFGLALRLSPKAALSDKETRKIEFLASNAFTACTEDDNESGDLQIGPDHRFRRYY